MILRRSRVLQSLQSVFGSFPVPCRGICECSAATSSLKPVAPAAPGSVQEYHHHILLRLPKPSGIASEQQEIWWPPKLEQHPAVQAAFAALVEHREDIEGLVKVTAFENWPSSSQPVAKDHADLLFFPTGTAYQAVPFSDIQNTVGSMLSSELLKQNQEDERRFRQAGIFVCTHGQRDARCGYHGTQIARIFSDYLQAVCLDSRIKVYQISHVGGHKYAGNVLVYGGISACDGDWFGGVTADSALSFIKAIIDCPLESLGGPEEPVLRPFWRGRLGMSKEEQLEFFANPQEYMGGEEWGDSEEDTDVDQTSSSSSSSSLGTSSDADNRQ